MMRCACLLLVCLSAATVAAAELSDYSLTDAELKLVRIDSDPKESFLAVQADSSGRLFVGGREALFVYEVDPQGGYQPRRELLRFPDHTWIYDIAIRGNDLYLLTVSALYLVPDAVTRREGLQPKRLVWGHPLGHVHQCFHGMALGPEGDIYFAMGDPLWNYGDFERPDHWGHWTFFSQPEGTRTPYTGVGGVFRCRPDGTGFQVVARGLRNSCGLCFDRDFNLFTNDNDHEGLPAAYVPGRLVHVTPRADFGWPRGWLASKTPERADLLETMSDKLGRFVPVGQAYYDETFLPERLRNNLLVARWCTRMVTNYPLEHRGASFRVEEQQLLQGQNNARPVGVAVGRGGRIFVTVSHMPHNDGSPTYKSDLLMITRAQDAEPYPFAAYEAVRASDERLWPELSDASFHRRMQAHTELLRRGKNVLQSAVSRLAEAKPGDPAAVHLAWLAGASGSNAARRALVELARSQDDRLRLQAVRVLAEYKALKAPPDVFQRSLADTNPQVRHAALVALFDLPGIPAEVRELARSDDSYLRQAATLLLAEKGSLEAYEALCNSEDRATRLAGVLAAGFRLTVPPATEPIPAHLPLDPDVRGPVIEFPDETIDLRKLGRLGNFTTADHWKVGRHTAEQTQLFSLLMKMLDDSDEQVRLQAAHFLSLLNDPRSEPAVVRVRQASEDRRLAVAPLSLVNRMWLCGPFADGGEGFQRIHPPEQGAVDVAAQYATPQGTLTWHAFTTPRMYDFVNLLGPCNDASCYAYFRLESGSRQRINLLVGSDDGIRVWHNGKAVWTNDTSRAALPYQDVIVLQLEPGSNDILLRVRNLTGASALYTHYRTLAPAAHVLPEKFGLESLAERLKSAGQGTTGSVPAEFFSVDWTKAAREGNAEQGRKLFEAAGCIKCHAVTAEATVTGGPSLADAGRRFTVAYLVESILLPSKQVSPVFRASAVITKDGRQLNGLVVGETAEKLELLQPDTKRITLAKSEIEERELLELSPMPQGVVKKPEELRDLLAYLLQSR